MDERTFVFVRSISESPFFENYSKKESELSDNDVNLLISTAISKYKEILDSLPEQGKIRFKILSGYGS